MYIIIHREDISIYFSPVKVNYIIVQLKFTASDFAPRVRSIMRAFYALPVLSIRAIDKTTMPSRIYGIPSARAAAQSFREHRDCRYFLRFTPRNGSISFDLDETNTLTKPFPSCNVKERILKHRRYYSTSLPFSRETWGDSQVL